MYYTTVQIYIYIGGATVLNESGECEDNSQITNNSERNFFVI